MGLDFAAIDFETATSSRASACAVGVTVVRDGEIVETASTLIRPPGNEYEPRFTAIHGLGPRDTREAPHFTAAMVEVWMMVDGLPLVAHNAAFDMSVVRAASDYYEHNYPTCDYLCSMHMSRSHWKDSPGYSLPLLAKRCGIEFDHHKAEQDALVAAKLVLRIAEEREAEDLMKLTRRLRVDPGHLERDWYYPCSGPARAATGPRKSIAERRAEACPDPGRLDPTHPFCDADVAFTGTLASMKRDDAMALVERHGGRGRTTVSPNTEYLVVGSVDYDAFMNGVPSSKLAKALALKEGGHPLVILSEEEFLESL